MKCTRCSCVLEEEGSRRVEVWPVIMSVTATALGSLGVGSSRDQNSRDFELWRASVLCCSPYHPCLLSLFEIKTFPEQGE
jgi:hypothetical protein